MPEISTVDDFLHTAQRSGLVDRNHLADYLRQLGESAPPPDQPAALAGYLVRDALLTSYQARQLLAGKWQRFTLLGKYKILDVIGVGGMGRVYLCEHVMLRRLVAVKVLPLAKTSNALAVERFYREARAVAALNHPNIVRCFDVDQDAMLHFMVMEYIDGANFEIIVRLNERLEIHRAAHYIRQAALGLQHAHEAGWVHRDIKPANLLLDRSGTVKLLDLGLARLFADPGDNLTKVHDESAVLGTADYIAPEQAVASHDVDIRADIYSLGCTLYFCLSGRPPFNDGTIAQKLIWHQMRHPESLRQLRPEVPESLAAVVERMLAKDATQRYQTPAEVAAALEPWTQEPIAPPPVTEMPRLEPLIMALCQNDPASGSFPRATAPGATTSSVMRRIMAPPLSGLTGASSAGPISGMGTNPGLPLSAPTIAFAESKHTPPHPPRATPPHSKKMQLPTGPKTPGGQAGSGAKGKPPAPTPTRRWLVLGLAALVLLGGGALIARHLFSSPKETANPQTGSSQPATTSGPIHRDPSALYVSRNPRLIGQANTYPSVRTALDRVHAGQRIIILDQFYEETLTVDGKQSSPPASVTIEGGAENGQPVTWQLPGNATENVALISLIDVPKLRLKGIVFDAEHRVEHLISLSGQCPGLTLEDVHLRGFNVAGVLFTGCSGTAEAPVTLKGVRVTTRAKEGAASALALGAAATRHLLVTDCRFEGPFKAAVRIDGPTSAVEFRRDRFYNATAAIRVKKTVPALTLRLVIDSNTFSDVKAALQLDGLPSLTAGAESQVTLTNNLFAKTDALVALDDASASEKARALLDKGEGNVRDNDSASVGLSWVPAAVKSFQLPTVVNDDARFLRYPKSSPLATAGVNGQPVGVPPVE